MANNPDSSVPEKYLKLLDAQILSYIDRVNACYPSNAVNAPISEQRKFYDAMCLQLAAPIPPDIEFQNIEIAATTGYDGTAEPVQARLYKRPTAGQDASDTVVVYFHGGGFVVGNLESHHDICAEICQGSSFDVLSVDYRLSPEHLHPAAFNDAVTAVSHAFLKYRNIVLCGDSAGANLAAAVSGADSINTSRINGQVLIYPGLAASLSANSYSEHAYAPMLTREDVAYYLEIRTPEAWSSLQRKILTTHRDDLDQLLQQLNREEQNFIRTLAPLASCSFSNLPYTVAFAAQCDPLHDDAVDYCAAVNSAAHKAQTNTNSSAGVKCAGSKCFSEDGLVHGYLRARHSSERAGASFERIVEEIRKIGISDCQQ